MEITPGDIIDQQMALLDAWVDIRGRIAALEAEASSLLAERMRLCRSEADDHPFHRDTIHRSMVAEFAAAGRVSAGSMEYAFTDSAFLHRDHGVLAAAFSAGRIAVGHMREVVRAAHLLRDAISAGRVERSVLTLFDTAAIVIAESETPARTRVHVRELAAALAGSTAVEQHTAATAERNVTMRSVGDGLAALTVVLPEHLAVAIMDRLTRITRAVISGRGDRKADSDGAAASVPMDTHDQDVQDGPDGHVPRHDDPQHDDAEHDDPEHGATAHDETRPADTRTVDQVRADLLTDLLLTADPHVANGSGLQNVQAHVQVTIAATTLAGQDDLPAQLDGHGPLHPDIARDLAAGNGGWTRLFLDPSGFVRETDTYSPTEPMRRFLRARDQHCRFPGCRTPANRCQIDHTHEHARGGRTEVHNLSHLCAAHHVLKHPDVADEHRWSARQLPDGSMDWVSPTGRRYRDSPPRRVMFV